MFKSPIKVLMLLAVFAFSFVACDDDDDDDVIPNTEKTVAQIAADDDQFSTLVSALQRVNLVSVLEGAGPFTVFAPTNDAFDALGIDLATLSDEALEEILLYHVFVGQGIAAADITDNAQTYLGTAAATGPDGTNLSLLVERAGSAVTLNGDVNVIIADITGNNGVIHAVDKVLIPLDIVEHAIANSNFTELVVALEAASGNLVSVLSGDGSFTVFAPVNSAFTAISAVVEGLTPEQLESVLTYHVVGGNIRSTDLTDGMMVTTVNGDTFTINLGSSVTITDTQGNTAEIVLTDVQGTNGVIHVLNAVILPNL